jgi:hypothetical protein
MEEALHRLQSRGAEDDGRNAHSRLMPSQTRHERAVRPWDFLRRRPPGTAHGGGYQGKTSDVRLGRGRRRQHHRSGRIFDGA